MLHELLRTFGLILALPLSVLAGELREVPVKGTGFIGPVAGANAPETTPCGNLRYSGSVGFPYLNRSLVIDLGEQTLVHKLKMRDDHRDNGGTSPTLTDGGLSIYTSADGRTYRRYTEDFMIRARSGKPEGVLDVVEIEGLALFARYIKLHADRADDRWDFANNNLQKMMRAYQDVDLAARIVSVDLPRYSAGRLRLAARLDLPKLALRSLRLDVGAGDVQLGQVQPLPSGTCQAELDVSALPIGPHDLTVRLVTDRGSILAMSSAKTYVVSKLIDDAVRRGPPKDGAGQLVMLRDLARYAGALPRGWRTSSFTGGGTPAAQPLLVADDHAAGLSIVLPAAGWHAVAIGLVGGDSEVAAKLDDGGSFGRRRLEVWRDHERASGLGEALVGCADLNATALTLRPIRGKACRLAFVRLLGLSDAQIGLVKATHTPNKARRVTVNNDGVSMCFSGMDSKERIHAMIDRYANKRLYSYDYCTGSDASCTYDTKVGTVFGTYKPGFWRQGDRRAHDNIQKLIGEGNDPLRVVIDHCHAQGLRVHASFRMNANYPPPMADTFNGELYWKHYDCRIMMRYGRHNCRLSYAYPQVRAFRLALIKEAIGYGPDGFHLDFLRHPPFMGYDEPLVAKFKERYGVDPLKIPEDQRWYRLCAEVMTSFVRDVRRALDEAGRTRGKHLTLSASFDYCNYRAQGLDPERWVKEGIVDNISPGRHGLGGIYFSVAPFAQMVRGTKCQLFPRLEHIIAGHDPTPESERGEVTYESERMTLNLYRARALELYDEGAQGLYLFNTSGLQFIDALSDIDRLRAWDAFEQPLVGWFASVAVPAE